MSTRMLFPPPGGRRKKILELTPIESHEDGCGCPKCEPERYERDEDSYRYDEHDHAGCSECIGDSR